MSYTSLADKFNSPEKEKINLMMKYLLLPAVTGSLELAANR